MRALQVVVVEYVLRMREGGDHDCKMMMRGMWLGVGVLPVVIMILEGDEVHDDENDDEKGMMKIISLAILEIMVPGDDGDPHCTKGLDCVMAFTGRAAPVRLP